MDDGTPPPDSVVIERVCNGIVSPEAYTNSKGHFSFQVGQNTARMADASISSSAAGISPRPGDPSFTGMYRGEISRQDLAGCELRASLAGYRSDAIMLSGRRALDNPDVGTIVLHRLVGVEGSTISATSLLAPKDARKAYEKGRNALSKKKWEEAQRELQKAIEFYPQYAAAWYELGSAFEGLQKPTEAREAYKKAVAADPKFVKPYLPLAVLAAMDKNWQEVDENASRVIKLNPGEFPVAYFLGSVAQYNMGHWDAAEKLAREGLKSDPQHRYPKINQILGMTLAQKGDFAGSAAEMKNYLQFAPNARDVDLVRKQLAEIERLAGPVVSPQR